MFGFAARKALHALIPLLKVAHEKNTRLDTIEMVALMARRRRDGRLGPSGPARSGFVAGGH